MSINRKEGQQARDDYATAVNEHYGLSIDAPEGRSGQPRARHQDGTSIKFSGNLPKNRNPLRRR